MAERINITVSAKIKSGPSISFSESLSVDAYDKLDIVVAPGTPKTIQLLPPGTTSVHLLLIKSSQYSDQISYTVNGAGSTIILDTPQNFIGLGSLATLDDANDPATLVFTNDLAEDVNIQILVGRNAT